VVGWRDVSRYGIKRAALTIIVADQTMPADIIAIASDHAGFQLKSMLREELAELGFAVLDLGTDDTESVDYPDFAYAMSAAFRDGRTKRGVLVCGSGIGISMAANRNPEIRAALIHDSFGARMARLHNDANVICFGGRAIGFDVARDCLRTFLETEFEGGRHARRVEKLNNPV
jgi:ribose 5-phosphate isomerase B